MLVRVHTLLALALFGLAGCRPVYPSDRLVIVELSPELAAFPVQTLPRWTTLGELGRQGIHYWHALGADLRMRDELTPFDDPGAPVLRFHGGELAPDLDGFFDWQGADVTIDTRKLKNDVSQLFIISMFAHEAGHALGLDHVEDRPAIMFHIPTPLNAPSELDEHEFRRVCGPK